MKNGVIRLLTTIADNRGDEAAATMVEMGDPIPEFDRTAYEREIASLIARLASC